MIDKVATSLESDPSHFENLFSISVILPIRNEERFIRATLEALLNQDYPAELVEIIIADGLSTDRTLAEIQEIKAKSGPRSLQGIPNPGRVYPTGFNLGVQASHGDIVIMMGGHVIVARDYFKNCISGLEKTGADCVGGPIETISATEAGQVIATAMASPFGVGGVAFRMKQTQAVEVESVAFGAYRRSAIDLCGLMDEELIRNQDDEYNYRLRKLGGRFFLIPEIQSKYHSRGTYQSLLKQYFQYGLWKVRVLQKHPAQMMPRHFIPFLFVSALILSLVLAVFSWWGWLFFIAGIGSYALANLFAAFTTSRQKGRLFIPQLPLVFAILHFSYGFGFLAGLVKFWNRWKDKKGKTPERVFSK